MVNRGSEIIFAPFYRRIGAIVYDSILLVAILIIVTLCLLPFTLGNAIASNTLSYQIFLLFIIFSYFLGFWYFTGQTLGMVIWKIQLVDSDHLVEGNSADGNSSKLSLKQVLGRFLMAVISMLVAGAGILWCFVDPHHLALYDRFAKTKLILKR
jgi:uncharacterized RDD family membrane protein YckC